MPGKPFVIEHSTGRKNPFLRGILVQSLVTAGISFQDAYDVARHIRERLDAQEGPLDTQHLRQLVAEELERRFGAVVRRLYEAEGQRDRPLLIHKNGRVEPFSIGVLTRYLEGCGIPHQDAAKGARLVHDHLRSRSEAMIERESLRRIIYETLNQDCCHGAADRFLSRCRFNDSGEPLIILIGGTTGAGKSTVAAQLAYLLDIVRTQSTDMMREIIRSYLVPHVAPTLDFSSFDAWRGLPHAGESSGDDPIITGFLSQFGIVRVALEATIQRAVKERQHLIVDGVHVLPSHLDLEAIRHKAILAPLMIAVTTRTHLDDHLVQRSREQPDRDSAHHREMLDAIWQLQSFLVDQAEKAGVPVIANWDPEETLASIMEEINARIRERFPPDPQAMGWCDS